MHRVDQAYQKIRQLVGFVQSGKITIQQAIASVSEQDIELVSLPSIKENIDDTFLLDRGMVISKGAASGRVIFSVENINKYSGPIILVKNSIINSDFGYLDKIQGLWLFQEDISSHAAIVIRVMGKPCVTLTKNEVSCSKKDYIKINNYIVREGDHITIDGFSGAVYSKNCVIAVPSTFEEYNVLMSWLDELNKMKIYANADLPNEVRKGYDFFADGIDVRTEHMFFEPERLNIFRQMLFSEDAVQKNNFLLQLTAYQANDFYELYQISKGKPITIRLLDPPLHEFLPANKEALIALANGLGLSVNKTKRIINNLREQNPMLGCRGARLLVLQPDIVRLQSAAMFSAAKKFIEQEKGSVYLKICIPMVSFIEEIDHIKQIIETTFAELFALTTHAQSKKFQYFFGIMVETPRISLLSDRLIGKIQFVSFGTNDLTALTFGFSRGDMYKRYFNFYKQKLIANFDPFFQLDNAVSSLVSLTIQNLKNSSSEIQFGLCGEQASEKETIKFCQKIGMTSLSCSPAKIPVVKLLVAKAKIEDTTEF